MRGFVLLLTPSPLSPPVGRGGVRSDTFAFCSCQKMSIIKMLMRYRILLLAILLTACSNRTKPIASFDENNRDFSLSRSIDQKCVEKGQYLQKYCAKAIDSLSLQDLQDCLIFVSDKELYNSLCNQEWRNISMDIFLAPGATSPENGRIFIQEINKRCHAKKIGDMTLPDLELCLKTTDLNNFIESMNQSGKSENE